jgi:hypothetical protein
MISKAFGLLKEKIKIFSFDVKRLKKLNHARNGGVEVELFSRIKIKKKIITCVDLNLEMFFFS